MTELDPSIILHASDGLDKIPSYDEIVAVKQKRDAAQQEVEVRKAAIAEHQRAIDEAARTLALQKQVGGLAATGDLEGADKAALGAGDFDLHGHVKGLQDEHRAALARKAETGAQVAYAASQMPYEQRRAAIQQATPQLVNAGWTPEEIAAFDPTDQNINELVGSTQSIKDALERHDKAATLAETTRHNLATEAKPIALASDSILVDPSGGAGTGGAPSGGRYTGGWTPRHANGGDNSDAVVDAKISGMASALGLAPTDDLRSISPVRIAQALSLSEGGPGSMADRNNNPANLTDAKTGAYRKFPTKAAGIAAAAAQVARNISRGQTTIQSMVEGLPAGGGGHGARVIASNPKTAAAEGTPTLSPGALTMLADRVMNGEELPNLGMGKSGTALKAKIYNMAAEKAAAAGLDGQALSLRRAARKANQQALGQQAKQYAATQSAEQTAISNGALVVSAANTGAGTTGAPLFNRWQQAYRSGVKGDPAVVRFGLAINTFANEYAKVVSGSTGNAAVTEGARQEMLRYISTASTPQQVAGIVQQARKEMANRTKALKGQLNETQEQLRTASAIGGDATAAPVRVSSPQQALALPKGTVFITPDGRRKVR